jgi:hypothetical protein
VLGVYQDPDDPQRRVMATVKSNLAKISPSLTFSVDSDEGEDLPYVVWHGETHHTAEILNAGGMSATTNSNIGSNRQEILSFLKEAHPETRMLQEIKDALEEEQSPQSIYSTLKRMIEAKQVEKVARNTYRAIVK